MDKLLILFCFLISQTIYTQSYTLSELIDEIEIGDDVVLSVYNWIGKNIHYDVNKLNKLSQPIQKGNKPKFSSEEEYHNYLLQHVLLNKSGVCQDYSLLFDQILKKLGYESFIVEGYTKNVDGQLNQRISHTWNAVKVKGKWKLYDPTWGSGYLNDDDKYVKHFDEQWYDVPPTRMIRTHMPFDPIWQLSTAPLTYSEFENELQQSGSTYLMYDEIIKEFIQKSRKEQIEDQLKRSKDLGNGIHLIAQWRKNKTNNLQNFIMMDQGKMVDIANDKSGEAVNLYNLYAVAKNHQFKGVGNNLIKAELNLIKAKENAETAIDIFKNVKTDDPKNRSIVDYAVQHTQTLLNSINKELQFCKNRKLRQ